MDVWRERMQQDVSDLKSNQLHLKNTLEKAQEDVQQLKMNERIQDIKINNLDIALTGIKEDTTWIRKKITGAIITALCGGIVAVVLAQIF